MTSLLSCILLLLYYDVDMSLLRKVIILALGQQNDYYKQPNLLAVGYSVS